MKTKFKNAPSKPELVNPFADLKEYEKTCDGESALLAIETLIDHTAGYVGRPKSRAFVN